LGAGWIIDRTTWLWRATAERRLADVGVPRGLRAESKARAIRHYQEHAERYDRMVSRGPLRHLRERERQAVLHLAGLDDPSKRTVIDVGCGGGYYSRAAKRAGKWVHAVDAAPAMIERIEPAVDVAEVADIETFAAPRTYDVVICCGVLDFVAHPETAFENLCRLCAPGGRLVVLLPRAGAGSLIYMLEKRLHGLGVNFYRRDWLIERARRRGLELTDLRQPLPYNMALLFERDHRRSSVMARRPGPR
jgi:SAM-dependent methyltransferase